MNIEILWMGGCLLLGVLVGVLAGVMCSGRLRWPLRVAEPLPLIAEHLPMAVLLFEDGGNVSFANRMAEELLFDGQKLSGHNFLHLLSHAPKDVASALTGSTDALFSLPQDGELQTFQMLRREVEVAGVPHTLLLINALTREVARRELDVLKKVVRVICHELNNSLASMSSLVSSGRMIIEHPQMLPKLARVLDGIEGRTHHLQRFVGEYAQLSRLPVSRPHEVELRPLLERVHQLYPTVKIHDAPRGAGFFDEVQVEQCLINLLRNAFEAGGSEEQVELALREVDACLEVGVLDRGDGFSEEALQQGLLPFYSTKQGGSGVGLALCREVADGHRGALRIKNREGGGSAVYLVLPLRGSEPSSRSKAVVLTLTRT